MENPHQTKVKLPSPPKSGLTGIPVTYSELSYDDEIFLHSSLQWLYKIIEIRYTSKIDD